MGGRFFCTLRYFNFGFSLISLSHLSNFTHSGSENFLVSSLIKQKGESLYNI